MIAIVAFFASMLGLILFLFLRLLWKFPLVKKIGLYLYNMIIFNAILRSFV